MGNTGTFELAQDTIFRTRHTARPWHEKASVPGCCLGPVFEATRDRHHCHFRLDTAATTASHT